ncbi:MAG: aldo/keto reductase [Candidatus Cryptobacteroides sp.]
MDRRSFLKIAGAGAAAAAAVSCAGGKKTGADTGTMPSASTGEGDMEYRDGAKGDRVSLLGYGCMRWPMIGNDRDAVIDQEKVNELVDRAIAGGVNYFDTSPAYLRGQSEKATGIALARYPRKSYYIATKLSNFADFTRRSTEKMYHDSFDQMQTDWFDYYLLHAIGRGGYNAFKTRYEDNGIMEFLLKEREAGRIRNLGFSFHGSKSEFDQLLALDDKYHWDFVQIQLNYLDWRHADGVSNSQAEYLYGELDRRSIPVAVMEPIRGGFLASPPESVARQFKERRPADSSASWAFRFAGSYPRIMTVLSGMTYMEHLEDNLKTFRGFQYMSEEELEFMDRMAGLIADYPTVECTGCQYCMPCPYGINIPKIFKHYNDAVKEGLVAQSASQEDFKRLRKAYLTGYNREVPPLRQADHCIGCGQCKVHCPQSIDIPRQLHRIDRYVEKLKRDTL